MWLITCEHYLAIRKRETGEIQHLQTYTAIYAVRSASTLSDALRALKAKEQRHREEFPNGILELRLANISAIPDDTDDRALAALQVYLL